MPVLGSELVVDNLRWVVATLSSMFAFEAELFLYYEFIDVVLEVEGAIGPCLWPCACNEQPI